jgi:membrane-anchored protein YejM (alkaline phosphatase superfamily)
MPLLGVKNPARDYSIGTNLLSNEVRTHAVLAEWSSTAYIEKYAKIAMPHTMIATQHPLVTGSHDETLSDKEQDAVFTRKSRELAGMMEELGRYLKKSGK